MENIFKFRVADSKGLSIPSANVKFSYAGSDKEINKKIAKEIVADYSYKDKHYQVEALPVGKYKVTIAVSGFEELNRFVKINEKGISTNFVMAEIGQKLMHFNNTAIPLEVSGEMGVLIDPSLSVQDLENKIVALPKKLNIPTQRLIPDLQEYNSEPQQEVNKRLFAIDTTGVADQKDLLNRFKKEKRINAIGPVVSKIENKPLVLMPRAIAKSFEDIPFTEVENILKENEFRIYRKDIYDRYLYFLTYEGEDRLELLSAIERLLISGNFEFIEPELFVERELFQVIPTDYLYPQQWYMNYLRLPDAWQTLKDFQPTLAYGSADVVLAVFDDGIESNTAGGITTPRHQDFQGNVIGGDVSGLIGNSNKVYAFYDFDPSAAIGFRLMVPNNDSIVGSTGHGVGCAVVATGLSGGPDGGSPGNQGAVGAAPNSRLLGGRSDSMAYQAYINAWNWMAGFHPGWFDDGVLYANAAAPVGAQVFPVDFNTPGLNPGPAAHIISNSFGLGGAVPANLTAFYHRAPSFGRNRRGTLLLFAAANNDVFYQVPQPLPIHEKVLTIAACAIDQYGEMRRSSYSCWGNNLLNGIDFCAPGHYYYTSVPPFGIHHNPPINQGAISGGLITTGNLPNAPTVVNQLNGATVPFTGSITVDNSAGFVAGMAILVGPNNDVNSEGAVIAGVVGNTLNLVQPLFRVHNDNDPVSGGLANNVDNFGGTSCATPIASGVTALVLSANSNLSFWEVRNVLRNTAIPIDIRLGERNIGVAGTPQLHWQTAPVGGAAIVDNNGILNLPGAANTSITQLANAGDTTLQVANAAVFNVGEAILIGAETILTANANAGDGNVSVVRTNDFVNNTNIVIGDGADTNLSRLTPAGTAIVRVGNTWGFRVGQAISIGVAPNIENFTIVGLGAVGGATPSTRIQLNVPTGVAHNIYDPVILTNREVHQVTNAAAGPNLMTLGSNLANTHTIGGANPDVIVRAENTEIRIIRAIDTVNNILTIDRLTFNQVIGTQVNPGLIPRFSNALGFGMLDAEAAVKAALNYDHDARDLMIRNHLLDDGKFETDPVQFPTVISPDLWVDNLGGAAPVPANYQISGETVHQKPRRGGNRRMSLRVGNRGNANPSFDYSVHAYLGLIDIELDQPISVKDFDPGFFLPSTGPGVAPQPYSINSGNPGTILINTWDSPTLMPAGANPTINQSGTPGDNQTFNNIWNQADMPTLPLPYPTIGVTIQPAAAALTVFVEHTRGYVDGQTVLIDVPGGANYQVATINGAPTENAITFAAAVGALPVGTRIARLSNTQTTIAVDPAVVGGATSTAMEVADADGFQVNQYIILGVAGGAGSEILRIDNILRTPGAANDTITVVPAIAAAPGVGAAVTRIGGELRTYFLGEVTPHDGLLAGDTVYNNNNISYREVNLMHDIFFRDISGNNPLTDQVQVTVGGAGTNIQFEVHILDPETFMPDQIEIEVIRRHTNPANNEIVRFFWTPPVVAPATPGFWSLSDAVQNWLQLFDPVDEASAPVVMTVAQDEVHFIGDFDVDENHAGIEINVITRGNYTPFGGVATPFVTRRTHTVTVFSVPGLPAGNANQIQAGTGTQVLAGTQRIHVFADMANLEQTQLHSFGIRDTEHFRLTSTFTTAANPGVDVRAFAVLDSLVFIQHNVADNLINLVLRPLRQAQIGFTRVKYFIYRGLRADDFISAGNPLDLRASTGAPVGNFVDSINQIQTNRGVVGAVPLTALGWDPLNQNDDDFLDNYFYSTDPDQQLPVVKRGMSLGRFNNALAASEFGFEIVLAEGYYPISLANIRASNFILDVSTISNADERRWKRQEILNYIDPAAYFGMHFYSEVEVPDPANIDPNVIQTNRIGGDDIYTDIVSQFFTRNILYIDIRNENGYSYNFYDNYTFSGTGLDNGNSLRTGVIPPDITPLTSRKYKTQEWPILIQDNTGNPVTSDNDFNNVYLELVKGDNGDPILYLDYGFAITPTTNNNFFITRNDLQNQSVVDAIAGDVITVRNNVVADINVGDVVNLSDCGHRPSNRAYIVTARAANGGNPAFTDLTMQAGTVDPLAPGGALGQIGYGKWLTPTGFSYPNQENPGNAAQRLDVAYVLKLRYCRQLNPFVRDVIGINQGTKVITVRGDIRNQLFEGQSIVLRGADIPILGTSNNASYTIAVGGIALAGADTAITVVEAIPQPYLPGPSDGEIVVDPKRVVKSSRYTDNVFGPLSSMIRSLPITAITVNGPASSTITVSGNYVNMAPLGTSIAIIDSANNNGRYDVSNAVLNAGSTELTIDTPSALNGIVDGKISIIYSIWNSTKPTKWITGFDKRYLDMTNDPLRDVNNSLHNFSYLGQTGIAVENQRAIFYMTPLDFFDPPTDANAIEVINMNGGLSDKESFWATMQYQNQRLSLNTTLLRVMKSGSEVLIPVFDFEDIPFDAENDIKKENFTALCLTKAELTALADLAQENFEDYHHVHFVLRNEDPEFDLNFESYNKYEVRLSGHKKNFNSELVATEIAPATPIYVYTLEDDRVIFSSEDFANLEVLDNPRDNYEEEFRMRQEALDILANNPPLQVVVDDFHTDLNAIDRDLPAILALIEAFGQLLWEQGVLNADAGGVAPFDDRPLYWARLHMRVSIRNHPYLKWQFRRRRKCLNLLEQHSRGLQTVDFAPGAGATHRILALGFDPFQMDRNIEQSNPSGAIALGLHGNTITNAGSGETAYIQTAIFPVRYKEFNDGMVEDFIKPFIDGTTQVDMIISCSQDAGSEFNVDRFASKYRNPDLTDNNNKRGRRAKFFTFNAAGEIKKISRSKLPEFIETNLPFTDMIAPGGTLPNDRVIYDQSYTAENPNSSQPDSLPNSGVVKNPAGIPAGKAKRGSGGTYLSNEIFYRIANLRHAYNVHFPLSAIPVTGHLHVPKLQQNVTDPFSQADTTQLVNDAEIIIEDALDGI